MFNKCLGDERGTPSVIKRSDDVCVESTLQTASRVPGSFPSSPLHEQSSSHVYSLSSCQLSLASSSPSLLCAHHPPLPTTCELWFQEGEGGSVCVVIATNILLIIDCLLNQPGLFHTVSQFLIKVCGGLGGSNIGIFPTTLTIIIIALICHPRISSPSIISVVTVSFISCCHHQFDRFSFRG